MASTYGKAPKRPVGDVENAQEELEKVAQALPIKQVKAFALHSWTMLSSECDDVRVAYVERLMVPGALMWNVGMTCVYDGKKFSITWAVHYHDGELHSTKHRSVGDDR